MAPAPKDDLAREVAALRKALGQERATTHSSRPGSPESLEQQTATAQILRGDQRLTDRPAACARRRWRKAPPACAKRRTSLSSAATTIDSSWSPIRGSIASAPVGEFALPVRGSIAGRTVLEGGPSTRRRAGGDKGVPRGQPPRPAIRPPDAC